MNDTLKVTKVSVIEILKDTIKLYRENFKILFYLSLIIFFIKAVTTISSDLVNSTTSLGLKAAYSFLSFIILILSYYFTTKVSIAIIISLSKIYHGEKDLGVRGVYKSTSEKIWGYIGMNILLGLIISLPLIGIINSLLYEKMLVQKLLLIVIFSIPTLYLYSKFGFAPILYVLDGGKKKYFKSSSILVKGNLWPVAMLTLAIFIMTMVPYNLYANVFNDFKHLPVLNRYIASFINELYLLFILPITNGIRILLYYKLKEIKRL